MRGASWDQVSLRKSGVGRLNNVRSKGRRVQVKLFGSLFSHHFIILSCHGDKLYITSRLSPLCLSTCCLNALFSLSFSLSIVSTRKTGGDNILIQWENPSNARLQWQEGVDKPKQPRGRLTDQTLSVSLLARLPFSETSGFKGIIHFTV